MNYNVQVTNVMFNDTKRKSKLCIGTLFLQIIGLYYWYEI